MESLLAKLSNSFIDDGHQFSSQITLCHEGGTIIDHFHDGDEEPRPTFLVPFFKIRNTLK